MNAAGLHLDVRPGTARGALEVVFRGDDGAEETETVCELAFEARLEIAVAGPLFELPAPLDEARAFAEVFLNAEYVDGFQRSAIVRRVLSAARPWRGALRGLWYGGSARLARLCVERGGLCGEYLALYDASNLVQVGERTAPRGLEEAAYAVLRRLRPESHLLSASWRASAAAQLRVDAIGILALSEERWRDVHAHGAFDGAAAAACRHGLLTRQRHLVLPIDATAASISLAVLELFPTLVRDDDAGRVALPLSGVITQAVACCRPQDRLRAARVLLQSESGAVVCEPTGADVDASHAVARWPGGARLRQAFTPSRERLRVEFPGLCARLEERAAWPREASSLYEIQVRRVAHEWSFEGVDAGSDLSSLGLSVLLALVLELWYGCRCSVCIGPGRGAACLVDAAPAAVLLDPARCNISPFEVQIAARPADVREPPPIGAIVEVRKRTRWYISKVRSVRAHLDSFSVQLFCSDETAHISISTGVWRRLGVSGRSDAERIIRRYRRRLLKANLQSLAALCP